MKVRTLINIPLDDNRIIPCGTEAELLIAPSNVKYLDDIKYLCIREKSCSICIKIRPIEGKEYKLI